MMLTAAARSTTAATTSDAVCDVADDPCGPGGGVGQPPENAQHMRWYVNGLYRNTNTNTKYGDTGQTVAATSALKSAAAVGAWMVDYSCCCTYPC